MKMVSMKRKQESEDDDAEEPQEPVYDYGSSLYITDDHVEELGLDECKIGEEVTIKAKAKVTGRSEREMEGSEKRKTTDLQITEMGIDKEDDSGKRAEKLYS